ncbi:HlyC/CorC family transporter [Candidatus Kaiserbacteria bacterium]|nr:HlyC/CorC family transporter [Candidatus Kaiserbacteria bacterium]
MEYLIVFILLVFSAMFSGLTLGLMSWDAQELKRKADSGDRDAAMIYPVRKDGNLLLTTLLIGNVLVNSLLSIFIASLTAGILAVVVATSLIVMFGEILPQAIFNRSAIYFGARLVWLVRIFIFLLYPIARPISIALDKVLGRELPNVYSKQELVKLIEDHEDSHHSDVDEDEERIITGALTFSDKKVGDIMTPRTVVHSFDVIDVVDEPLLQEVRESGLSRFPVYRGDIDTIVGMLYSSQLIGADNLKAKVGDIAKQEVHFIQEDMSLDNALEMFLKTRKHLSIVKDAFGGVVGVLTLEDVLEEIICSEIIDERDVHTDMRAFALKDAKR